MNERTRDRFHEAIKPKAMRELTTGKNKEQFKDFYYRWRLLQKEVNQLTVDQFNNLPLEMKTGVYLAYYDGLDTIITVEPTYMKQDDTLEWIYAVEVNRVGVGNIVPTRNEAYTEALKQADLIENEKLKG